MSVGGADDLELLGADADVDDRRSVLGHDVGVGLDLTADHHLAEPECCLDHDVVGFARGGVDREHHARVVAVDHALHDDRDRGLRRHALRRSVREVARAEQRGPAVDDPLEELVVAAYVGERLVHARERRRARVLGGGRRADGDEHVVAQAVVRVEHVAPQRVGDPRLVHQLAQLTRRGGERRLVGGVDGDRAVSEVRPYTGSVHRLQVRRRGDHEPGRHGQPAPRQLTEVRALAAGEADVVLADVGEPPDPIAHGLLLEPATNGFVEPAFVVTLGARDRARPVLARLLDRLVDEHTDGRDERQCDDEDPLCARQALGVEQALQHVELDRGPGQEPPDEDPAHVREDRRRERVLPLASQDDTEVDGAQRDDRERHRHRHRRLGRARLVGAPAQHCERETRDDEPADQPADDLRGG